MVTKLWPDYPAEDKAQTDSEADVMQRAQRELDLALMGDEERKVITQGLLNAADAAHSEVMRAKYGDLVFIDAVTPARVFGRVQQLGVGGGIKIAIDKIKQHAATQVAEVAKQVCKETPPSMYDVEYQDTMGRPQTEKVLTMAAYILTEDEMAELERMIIERHLAGSASNK